MKKVLINKSIRKYFQFNNRILTTKKINPFHPAEPFLAPKLIIIFNL